ncbi:MAG TPA: hypothetical protein IAC31_10535 [Candidatus Faecousia intestinigallinarum]|nr:hypothetical protein [Candidatus Faecousia intestinigallinarum]
MEYIYIVLSNSGTIPGRAIQRMTHFPYGHAMLSFTADCQITYSFGRRSLYNIFNGGFVAERRDGPFFTRFSDTTCLVLRLKVTDKQVADLYSQIASFVVEAKRYRYDYIGLFMRYFNIKKTFDRRFVCSHFVAEMLQRAGIYRFCKGSMLVRPRDFLEIPGIETYYEGKLSELPRGTEE